MTEVRRALLDTSVVIDFPVEEVARHADAVAISAITVAELQFGVAAAKNAMTQLMRRKRLEVILREFEVLPFDEQVAEYYGALAALLVDQGRQLRPRRLDLQIAATAVRHGLLFLTRNGADFVGLESVLQYRDLVQGG